MKTKFLLLIIFPFFIACEGVEVELVSTKKIDTTMYTIDGRYLNGTTNKPYQNIELVLIMDNYGFPRILKDIAGPVRTDKEGYFKFTYQYIDRFPGGIYLEVFPTDLYPEIDSLPINQNINRTVYQSSFGSLILDINPITSNELYVFTGKMDTLHYTNISGNFSDTIRNVPMYTTMIAWGRTMAELRNSLKNHNGYQKYLVMNGDPYFNKVKIQF